MKLYDALLFVMLEKLANAHGLTKLNNTFHSIKLSLGRSNYSSVSKKKPISHSQED